MGEAAKKPGRGWFTRAETAEIFAVSEAQFDKHYRQMAPKSAEKVTRSANQAKKLWFKARDIIDAHTQHEIAKAVKAARPSDDLDAPTGGLPDDRLKTAKARLAELELRKQQGELLELAEVRTLHGRLAAILRGAGATLGRQYGPEAQKLLDEALADFEREVTHGLGE